MRVKVVEIRGRATLVEWLDDAGHLRRAVVPVDTVRDEEVEGDVLDRGVGYGAPWEEVVEHVLAVTPERVGHELRRRGLWTVADVRANPQAALAALQAALGLGLAALLSAETKEGEQ